MMTTDKWFVLNNPMAGYIAAKIKRKDEPMHSGNLVFYGEYTKDRKACQKTVDALNGGMLKCE